jgi:dCTP deaminase
MILCDKSIEELIKAKKLVIKPFKRENIQPASIDLRISDEILLLKGKEIDFDKEQTYERIKAKTIILPEKTSVLTRTIEYIELPNDIAGITKLRSSVSRIGLFLNNAGWIDPGFKGTLTLSVFNANNAPVKIKAGTRFFQLILVKLDKESRGYKGRYNNQYAITGKK